MPSSNWLPLANEIKDTTYYVFGLQKDVDYYIRVHAETKVGVSEPTEPVWIPRATVFPGVPVQRPQITEIEPTTARVSWTLANFPKLKQLRGVFYLLEVLIPPSKYWHTVAKEITDLSHVVTDLKPGQDYLFRVRARTILGKYSNPSPRTSLYKTLATSRAPIDGLEFEESDPNSDMIRLRWNHVDIPPYHVDEEPLFYTVEINDYSDDKWRPLVSGLPATKYKFKAPTPKRDYKFRVRAVTQYGLSPPSPTLLVSCKDSSIGSRFTYQRSYQVSDVHISHLQPDSCLLSWKPVKLPHLSSPVKYQIDVKGSSDIEWRPVAIGITETSLRVNGLDPKRDYNFKVTPLTSTNCLGALPYVTLTSMQESKATYIYHKSRKVHVSDLQLGSLTLSWKRPYQLELPVKYRIDVREFPDLEWRIVAVGITETKCRVTGLNPRRNYNFQVTPLTSVGDLEPLPYVTVTSMPVRPRLPPSEPILTEITKDTVQLSWQPAEVPFFSRVKQQILYCVEMTNESLNSNWTTVTPKTSNTMCFVNELSPDLDYQFRIKAYYMDLARIHTHSRPSLVVSLYRNSAQIFSRREPVFVGLGPDLKSVVLSWQPAVVSDPSKRASYRIEMQVPPQIGEWENIRNLQRFSTLVKMKADQDYFARVRAKIGDMITEPTLPIYVSKRTDPPIIPHEEPILSKIRSESVKLKWRSQSHVTNYYPITYRVEKQVVPNSDWTIEAYGIFSTNFHVVGLHPEEEYKFRILAESEIGISEPTPCVTLQKRLGEIADSSDSEQDGEEEGIEAKGREQHTCIEEYLDWEGNKWIIEEKQRGQNVEDSNNGEMFHGRNGDEDCDQNREENSNKVGLNRMVEKEDTCSSNKRPMDRKEKEVTSCDTKKRKPNDPEEGLIVCTEDEECSSLNEEYVNKSRMVEEDVIMHCQKEECSILYEEQARKGDRFEEAKDFEIKNPKVRKCEIVKLSLKTTHDRNVKALKDGKGEVYLLRSISSNGVKKERCEEEEDGTEKGRRDLSHYGPCPQCYGWVLLKSISRHSKSCILTSRVKFSNLELILQSNILSERIPNAASQALTEEVFSIMDKDHIYEVVCKDSSIIFLGNQLIFCNKGNKTMLPYYISSTMRLAARLKMAIQRIDKSSNDLADYFTPKKFDIVVQAALHCCNQSETDDEDLKSPSNLLKLRFDIRKMASVKYVNGQKHNDAVKRKEAEEFIKMMDQKWSSSVTKLVRDILVEHSYSRVKKLPPVEDLKKFVTYIQSHLKDLNFNDTSYNNFRRTVILALARITLFNRRSCEEVQAMRLAHYRDRKTGSDKVPEEIMGKMTRFEARLSERLEVVTIPGKISGLNIASSSKKEQAQEIGVPVILPGDVKEALQYIADPEVRRKAGIKEFNSYMFSNSRAGVFKAYDATQIVMQESAANLQAADLVRTSSMKNFMTTMFQVLCSTESEKQWVLNCIARNRRIRNLRFRKKSDFSDRIVDVVKILLIQDMGLFVEYREKRLDDIQLDKLVWDEEETTSQRESLDPQLETLDPQCKTLDPQRENLDPQCEASDLQCETLDPQCETLDPQAETVDPRPETLNMQNETLDPQQKTLDPQNETLGPQSENLDLQLEDEYIQLEDDFIPDLHEYLETEDEGEFDGKKRKIKVRWSAEEEAELKELFKEEFEKTLACPGVKQMRKKMKESKLNKNGLIYKRKMDNIRKKITHMLGKLNSKSQLEDDEPS
ncbi:hypothetical protein FSP39_006398 [Pinctada imbricata]|uniref:Fibronectin type-III domain-containing protein n=1 Tax=Pinctada imbricata TaxID=66713 RepID=A0AA89C3A2_PINIB|nr:hypothetical protein FSP39_006398 [Pinctada imbricata]